MFTAAHYYAVCYLVLSVRGKEFHLQSQMIMIPMIKGENLKHKFLISHNLFGLLIEHDYFYSHLSHVKPVKLTLRTRKYQSAFFGKMI